MANKILLTGRLCRDAELAYIPGTGTPKLAFTIAVPRSYQKDKNNKKVDFINCEQIGKHTENLCQYLTKGKFILVEGELNIDNYDKDGEKRSFTKVKIDRVEFLVGDTKSNDYNVGFTPSFEPPGGLDPQGFESIEDDDLPF